MNSSSTKIHAKTVLARSVLALFILLVGVDILLIWKYTSDNKILRSFASEKISVSDRPSDKTIDLLKAMRQDVRTKRNNLAIFLPVFNFLRPTPVQVLEFGGDCADKGRLLITLLHDNDIEASKVALYDKEGIPRHAVVEVQIENDNTMVVDALFGLYFPKPNGGYFTLEDLKGDESILKERVSEVRTKGEDGYIPTLASYPFERYTYRNPRTINWDKSSVMKTIYGTLKKVVGDRVDKIKRPFIVERPALMLLVGAVGTQFFLLAVYLLIVVKTRRPKAASVEHPI